MDIEIKKKKKQQNSNNFLNIVFIENIHYSFSMKTSISFSLNIGISKFLITMIVSYPLTSEEISKNKIMD